MYTFNSWEDSASILCTADSCPHSEFNYIKNMENPHLVNNA